MPDTTLPFPLLISPLIVDPFTGLCLFTQT
jgi:hypothetical protein